MKFSTSRVAAACALSLAAAFGVHAAPTWAAETSSAPTMTLPGHVIGLLPQATRLPRADKSNDPITISVMLKLSDQAGADEQLRELDDSESPNYHKPISPSEFTDRFGPTQAAYDAVRAYLESKGFTVIATPANRRTITVRGTRGEAENAFHVQIDDYQFGTRNFHAIAADPAVPSELAPLLSGVSGLSNLAHWRTALLPATIATAYQGAFAPTAAKNTGGLPPGIDGSGQTVGIVSFSDFAMSDVSNFLSLVGLPKSLINHVNKVDIAGGTSNSGNLETLLDVDSVLGMAQGAKIVVYNAPGGDDSGDFLTAINGAIDDVGQGGTLSMSWYLCEPDASASDAQGIDALLASAASSGITFFAATGDYGSTCVGDSTYPNTIQVPSDSPHAVAVGGTTLSVNSDSSYKAESWWLNGGAFGDSIYFKARGSSVKARAVPDVAFDADPNTGIPVCEANASSPTGCGLYGGTSMASPMWAAVWSMVNQANKLASRTPFSAANGYLETVKDAFHAPSSMVGPGNNATHLGLGSPIIADLVAKSAPAPRVSKVSPDAGPAAGGTTVTISGEGFTDVKQVYFGGVAATHVTIYSDSSLTAESPLAANPEVDVQVATPAGTSAKSSSDKFNYIPEISKISPTEGPLTGGEVTVSGRALRASSGSTFYFGGNAATDVKCTSMLSCTMNAPAHPLGTVHVTEQSPYGTSPSTSTDRYTYGAPTITGFSPAIGPTTGGMYVVLNGTNLSSGMTVDFGNTSVKVKGCVGPTYCELYSPSHAAGSVTLTATVNDVTSAPSKQKFTFETFPSVTSITPTLANAGTTVTLTGANFSTVAGATTFTFFGIPVAGNCSTTARCTAVVPQEVNGTAQFTEVTATVGGNTSVDSVEFGYPKPIPQPPCKPGTCK